MQPAPEGPPAPPADETVARVSPRSLSEFVVMWLPLIAALVAVWYAQKFGLRWAALDGVRRTVVELVALVGGFGTGLWWGAREEFPWASWPPEGVLLRRKTRLSLPEVAHAWWQLLWLVPFAAFSAFLVIVYVLLAVARPQDVAGPLYVSDLLWNAVLAGGAGWFIGGILLRPGADAITLRGVHTSPASFVPWKALSHAIAEPEERVIRLYGRRRPWLPRAVLAYRTTAEAEQAANLIAPQVPCITRDQEPPENRARWAAFLLVAVAAVVALTAALFWVLWMPPPQPWIGENLWMRILVNLVLRPLVAVLERMPVAFALVALFLGRQLDGAVARLRGVTTKRIVVTEE